MISLSSVAKGYGDRILFADVSLTISVSERIGLVGANGSGKSTLLDLLAGTLEPDRGTIARNRRATIGLLSQDASERSGRTLLEEMLAGHEALAHLRGRLALLEEEMRSTSDPAQLESLVEEHGELERRFDAGGGYDLPAIAKRILGGLGFAEADLERDVGELSGGWRMRLGLGRLLLTEPDLLLLDEPTNYLDLESVIWLEDYLRGYEGSIVIASHDRVLLNGIATRVLEIVERKVTSYAGNYDAYRRARAVREQGLEAARKAQEREMTHAQAFIDRFRAKNTKARQVQSRIKRLEKMERIESPAKTKRLRFAFPDPPPSGRVPIALRGVWKSYGGPPVYSGIDLAVERGDRIALVGPNGAGKSTLLKLLAGALPPDRGERIVDGRATLAYYAQRQVETLDYRRTVLEEAQASAPSLAPERLRALLGRFLFPGDDVGKAVGVLSGGEKARLALAKLLVHPPNVILLDEPTSHLDISARDVLEDALAEFPGTLVVISHDRHFLERLVTRVIEVGGGSVRSVLGGYSDYLEKKEAAAREPGPAGTPSAPSRETRRSKEARRLEAEARNRRFRLLSPLREELISLERDIEAMALELSAMETEMASPDFYREGNRFEETFRRYREAKAVSDAKLERWEELTRQKEELDRRGDGPA